MQHDATTNEHSWTNYDVKPRTEYPASQKQSKRYIYGATRVKQKKEETYNRKIRLPCKTGVEDVAVAIIQRIASKTNPTSGICRLPRRPYSRARTRGRHPNRLIENWDRRLNIPWNGSMFTCACTPPYTDVGCADKMRRWEMHGKMYALKT